MDGSSAAEIAAAPPETRLARRIGRAGGPVRIGLVDDHHLVREGLRLVLAGVDGLEVVGEASTHEEAFELVDRTRPDLLLLDLTFPEGDGLPLLRALKSLHPELRIVVLTMDRGSETVRQALVAGAQGYVVKGARTNDLLDAIAAVSNGERYLHSSVTAAIVDDSIRLNRSGAQLSIREREILTLLASGHSTSEVGAMLGISVHTVRRHVANLSDKLGIRGRGGLVRYAVEHGLIRSS
ncbi:MAG TPA: response regulator transcription factor [Candidatus Limnocylindrales bacterium]